MFSKEAALFSRLTYWPWTSSQRHCDELIVKKSKTLTARFYKLKHLNRFK